MVNTVRLRHAIALFAALAALPAAAGATDGYFTLGTGPVQNGLAGAGVALPQDSAIAASNPAGLVRVGNSWEIGVGLFAPNREYTVDGAPSGFPFTFGLTPGTVQSTDNTFLLPHFSWSRRLDDKSAIGIVFFGNGGLNTTYPGSGPGTGTFHAGATGVNVEQIFLSPTYSRKFSDRLALGAGLNVSYQTFRAGGLSNFSGYVSDGTADNLTDRGTDSAWGLGARLGALYDVSPKLTLGAAYQTVTSESKFSKYADLFAQQGGFNVPATATVGLAWKPSQPAAVVFDIEHIWYGKVASVANPFANLYIGRGGNPSYLLGGDNGPGFGWHDTTFYKLGYQTDVSSHLTLRGGIAYGKQPIAPSEVLFNILAPAVTEWHYALGASLKPDKQSEIGLAFVDVPTGSVSGPNPLDLPGQQSITLKMRQIQIEAGYSRKY
jgi:long-chain fatty acid transport protein